MSRVVNGTGFSRAKIIVGIRYVITNDVRPAEVARLFGPVKFVVPTRAAPGRVSTGIGTHFTPIDVAGLIIDRYPPGVAVPHRVYFGTGFFGAFGKQVTLGNGVGPIGFWVNPDDFPPQVVGIARRFLGIPRAAPFPLVNWVEGCIAGRRIVAGSQKQVAVVIEHHASAGMAALFALRTHFQQYFFGRHH